MKKSPKFDSEIRMNCGYWDGRNAAENNWKPGCGRFDTMEAFVAQHFDAAYAAGYAKGWNEIKEGGAK